MPSVCFEIFKFSDVMQILETKSKNSTYCTGPALALETKSSIPKCTSLMWHQILAQHARSGFPWIAWRSKSLGYTKFHFRIGIFPFILAYAILSSILTIRVKAQCSCTLGKKFQLEMWILPLVSFTQLN